MISKIGSIYKSFYEKILRFLKAYLSIEIYIKNIFIRKNEKNNLIFDNSKFFNKIQEIFI